VASDFPWHTCSTEPGGHTWGMETCFGCNYEPDLDEEERMERIRGEGATGAAEYAVHLEDMLISMREDVLREQQQRRRYRSRFLFYAAELARGRTVPECGDFGWDEPEGVGCSCCDKAYTYSHSLALRMRDEITEISEDDKKY